MTLALPVFLRQPTLAMTGKGRERSPKANVLILKNSVLAAPFWKSGSHLNTSFRSYAHVTDGATPAHFQRPRTFISSIFLVTRLHRVELRPKSLFLLSQW